MIRCKKDPTDIQEWVAEGVADGFSYEDIANAHSPPLAISTVQAHVAALAKKIEIDDQDIPSARDRVFLWIWHRRWLEYHRVPTTV